jgi:hypothetical protein
MPNSTPQRVFLNLLLGPLVSPKVNPVNLHLHVGLPVLNRSVSAKAPCPKNAHKRNKRSHDEDDSHSHKKLHKSARRQDKKINKQDENKSSKFASGKEKDSTKRMISPEAEDEYAAS